MQKIIFAVEDDENIRELVKCALESFSYDIETFETAEELLDRISVRVPNLILLDIMLPQMDGITALKRIKSAEKYKDIPVIMLTAKSSEIDKVKGLDCGSDDYITKPFGVLELNARVRAVLRRSDEKPRKQNRLIISDIEIDSDKREVYKDGNHIDLTMKEYDLLLLLAKNSNKVIPREEILDEVWGIDFLGETRTLDMHIKNLRTKLSDNSENPKYIKTIRGVGYTFNQEKQ